MPCPEPLRRVSRPTLKTTQQTMPEPRWIPEGFAKERRRWSARKGLAAGPDPAAVVGASKEAVNSDAPGIQAAGGTLKVRVEAIPGSASTIPTSAPISSFVEGGGAPGAKRRQSVHRLQRILKERAGASRWGLASHS